MERARGPGGQGQIVLGLVDLDERPGPSSKCSAEPPPPEEQHDPIRRRTWDRRPPCARHCSRRSALGAQS